jgi:hypothetical protein
MTRLETQNMREGIENYPRSKTPPLLYIFDVLVIGETYSATIGFIKKTTNTLSYNRNILVSACSCWEDNRTDHKGVGVGDIDLPSAINYDISTLQIVEYEYVFIVDNI